MHWKATPPRGSMEKMSLMLSFGSLWCCCGTCNHCQLKATLPPSNNPHPGYIDTEIEDGIHVIHCDLCGKKVRLTKSAHAANIRQHRGGRDCQVVYHAAHPNPGCPCYSQSCPVPSTCPAAPAVLLNSSNTAGQTSRTPAAQKDNVLTASLANLFSALHSDVPVFLCPGFTVELLSVWPGYAWGVHKAYKMGWEPEVINAREHKLTVWTKWCGSVTDAYAAPQADNLYEPLCRRRGARASQIRPRDKVRAVPKCLRG
jgi:hypothetical protein